MPAETDDRKPHPATGGQADRPLNGKTPFKGPLDEDGSKNWYNRYGDIRGSERPIDGRCGEQLWRTNPPRYCTKSPMKGRTKCRLHGGRSPAGVVNGNYEDGRFSKYLPKNLSKIYDEVIQNPEMVSLRADLALLETRQKQLLGQLDENVPPPWGTVMSAMMELDKARSPKSRAIRYEELKKIIIEGMDKSKQYERTWEQLKDLISRKTHTAGQEWKRMSELSGIVTIQDAMAVISALLNAAREEIQDRPTLERFQRRVLTYVPAQSK